MVVRAKFRCIEKLSRTSGGSYGATPTTPVGSEEVKFSAVMGDENKEWSQWTPSGELRMTVTNQKAMAQFEVGKDYFLDFTPASLQTNPNPGNER